jgi:hypothetical protein
MYSSFSPDTTRSRFTSLGHGELLKIALCDMSNEQLEIAMAFCRRQLALWDHSDAKRSSDIEPVAIE